MKQKRFSLEQIVGVLKQVEGGVTLAEVIRRVGSRRTAQSRTGGVYILMVFAGAFRYSFKSAVFSIGA